MRSGSREGKGPPATDLLVCFPSRAHLSLLPKPISSPARPSDPRLNHHRRPSHLRRPSLSYRSGASSPLPWSSRGKHNNDSSSEPTSPKVTCAGQIKVRTKPNSSCKNWQSVMEEIEKMHKRNKKKAGWIEALGFKKEVMQFLTCLRNVRFDFRCFGAVPGGAEATSEDEDDDDDEELDNFGSTLEDDNGGNGDGTSTRAVFSKWYMILQEDRNASGEESCSRKVVGDGEEEAAVAAPPKNALLLMRCRSAPAKSWLEERAEEEEEKRKGEIEREKGGDLSDFTDEIVEIDRVMEEIKEKISRCRSCKR